MEFTVPVTFAIDPAEWASEFGHANASEAVESIIYKFTQAARDGGLAEAIASQWPMMRDMATITVGAVVIAAGPSSFAPVVIAGCPVVSFTRLGQVDGLIPERGIAITKDGEKYNVHSCAFDRKGGRWSGENGAYGATWQRAQEIARERIDRDVAP